MVKKEISLTALIFYTPSPPIAYGIGRRTQVCQLPKKKGGGGYVRQELLGWFLFLLLIFLGYIFSSFLKKLTCLFVWFGL